MNELPTHPLLREIAIADSVPHDAIAQCMLCIPEVAPELLYAITRAAEVPVTDQSELNLVYYGAYILGGAREPRLQAPLLRLLRLPDDVIGELLGDDYVETLAQLVIGAFDGNAEALFDLMCDEDVDSCVRMPLGGAAAYLTWLGKIPAETMRSWLSRFDADRPIPAGDIGWNGRETAIELLGWTEFAPLVEAAYADGRLDTGLSELGLFRQGLAEAAADDGARFAAEGDGYIEDTLETIEFPAPTLGARDDDMAGEELMDWGSGFGGFPATRPGYVTIGGRRARDAAQSAAPCRAQRPLPVRQRQEIQEVLSGSLRQMTLALL
jgi:hypothetical protein